MSRHVDPEVYRYLKEVDRVFAANTGVRVTECMEYKSDGFPIGMAAANARLEGLNPEAFAQHLSTGMNLAPAASFGTAREAHDMNLRRAALVSFTQENPDWRVGQHGDNGAIYKEGEDGQVLRMSVARSRDGGSLGFEVALAEDARIVDWSSPDPGVVSIAPHDARFVTVAAGTDMVDAIDGYNKVYEDTLAASPTM